MASISRRLIQLCEEIAYDNGSGRPASSRSGLSGRSGRSSVSGMNSPLPPDDFDMDMGMEDMGEPMDDFSLDTSMTDTDIDVESNGDGANITIATPQGTSVTVTEARKRRMRESRRPLRKRHISESFFKTHADVNNLYAGDDAHTIHNKRSDYKKWMNESEGEEVTAEEEVTVSSTSGKDGRHVSGQVSDANGKTYDIDGTLAFSGDDLLIDDVNLDAVSDNSAGMEEEVMETETEETTDTGLEKTSSMDVTFEEKFGRTYKNRHTNEAQSSVVSKFKDPIGDLLNLRKSGNDVPPAPGKAHHGPVKRVHDNSLHNRREVDITKKGNPSQTDTKAPRYQTKSETE